MSGRLAGAEGERAADREINEETNALLGHSLSLAPLPCVFPSRERFFSRLRFKAAHPAGAEGRCSHLACPPRETPSSLPLLSGWFEAVGSKGMRHLRYAGLKKKYV